MTERRSFDDGAAYEQRFARWSQLAGEVFLRWLTPPLGSRWLDVGCGNGAFTQLLIERCQPTVVQGIDPSEAQLTYARTRSASPVAQFHRGDAMTQPFSNNVFDIAVMALVIYFVPDPARGVAEMVRVVRGGGVVAAYAWDMMSGGFPTNLVAMQDEMRALGLTPSRVGPNFAASGIDAMRDLWTAAGLHAVETREITVERTFASFDDLWTASAAQTIASLPSPDVHLLKTRLRARLPADPTGRITCTARANAVKGLVAK